jgi:hypothetical protein
LSLGETGSTEVTPTNETKEEDEMYQFTPWVWRDPTVLTAEYAMRPTDPEADTPVDDQLATADLVGYEVEATDGGIGKVDKASYEVDAAYLVVDTGPWIFGKTVLLPAGVVQHIDHTERKVFVDRTKDQIKGSPEYDPDTFTPEYRERIGSYYADSYRESAMR